VEDVLLGEDGGIEEDRSRPGVDEGGPQSMRKRRAIVDAATAAFLRGGYLGTSMDEIAALADVSKTTVYNHFADKEALFSAVVRARVDEASDPVHDEIVALAGTTDLERDLRELARRQLERVMQPHILALRRLVIAEAERFPELGRLFYERGAGRTVEALAETFTRLTERELLRSGDPWDAATHFNWLIMSLPVNRVMLGGWDARPRQTETAHLIDAGVHAFLAAYGAGSR
jgi:TetR/AcrR family transcriptional repressor of mexJK operon